LFSAIKACGGDNFNQFYRCGLQFENKMFSQALLLSLVAVFAFANSDRTGGDRESQDNRKSSVFFFYDIY
jgi:hypothetical protein